MDAVAVTQHLGLKGIEEVVLRTALLPVLQRLRPGDKGHLGHVGNGLNLRLNRPGLLLGIGIIDVRQKLVFRLQVSQHVVQIHRQQGERTHNQKAGHNHTHSGKRHEAVGKNGVEALADIISRIKFSRHCSTHLSRR